VSESNLEYGKNLKRIVFTDTDHRHAQLVIKLKNDGITQAKFFRQLITGYLDNDPRLVDFVRENGNLSIQRKNKIYKIEEKGKVLAQELGLDEEQVEDIFDMIAEEFPDL
jgi:hypothetical protein|tara:strand:- start:336 stop:665 length:330 start_codon:yes stop_codon:yes gene_type:complete